MSAQAIIQDAAAVATAVGVFVLAAQARVMRGQQRLEFERRFVDRYNDIVDRIPLAMLLGRADAIENDETLRAFYDYFELSEEELYYRATGRVSDATWRDWWEGIAANFRRPAFKSAWARLKDEAVVEVPSPNPECIAQFALLRKALEDLEAGPFHDPLRRRNPLRRRERSDQG